MFLTTGIKYKVIKASCGPKPKKHLFFVLQACLRRQEYRRDPNGKKRDQFWGQETNFERSRFSSGSSSKQVLRMLGDILLLQGVCVSVCVSLCVCVTDLGKSQPQEEMLKNLKGQGRERQGQELSPWVPPCPSSAV